MENNINERQSVLIVDDNPVNIKVIADILKLKNYRIAFAQSGSQVFKLLENNIYDLILLDIMMPNMDGYQVCKKLKSADKTKEIPVIFLSAKNETESIVKGFEYGAVDYLIKPFNAEELLARVKTHLELKKSREKIVEMKQALDDYNQQLEENLQERTGQLIKSEREAVIGQMIQGIVHNMRTPISVIFSSEELLEAYSKRMLNILEEENDIDLLKKKLVKTVENGYGKVTKRMKRSAEKLNSMIDGLMIKSKNDKLEDIETFNLNKIIEDDIEFLQGNLDFKNKTKKNIKLSTEPLMVKVASAEVSQVFGNLIKNSLDAMYDQEDAYLEIESGKDDKKCWFSIKDNGPGIPPEYLNKIFDPFFSTKPQKKNKDKGPIGTGLGLHFCKKAIEAFDGEIQIDTKIGSGTKFTIILPESHELENPAVEKDELDIN